MSNSTNLKSMRAKTLYLVQLGLFVAIELIFCFTPLGSIPISAGIVATLAHIPAILAALILGYQAAIVLGGVMGISSLIIWTATPPNALVAFAFSPFAPNGNFLSLIICILPRVLFPVATVWLFKVLSKKFSFVISAAIAAAGGTFVHSILVLSLIYVAFHSNATVGGNYLNFIIAWGGINAILEIVVAAILGGVLIVPLQKANKKDFRNSPQQETKDKNEIDFQNSSIESTSIVNSHPTKINSIALIGSIAATIALFLPWISVNVFFGSASISYIEIVKLIYKGYDISEGGLSIQLLVTLIPVLLTFACLVTAITRGSSTKIYAVLAIISVIFLALAIKDKLGEISTIVDLLSEFKIGVYVFFAGLITNIFAKISENINN